ncbi:hypothetical protein ACH5RR_037320 [Cinchona calisaya]|uniref:Reverse transcriptase n=1 Tax=Cinchona calisaya TaxID=153742 RepID=A0ABD2Y829_9GENT
MVACKRKRNRISCLQRCDGTWYSSEEDIVAEIAKFYEDLFKSSDCTEFDEVLEGIPFVITASMNEELTKSFKAKEVKEALFSMHPDKAPRPDSMTPFFFQKFWNIIGQDVADTVLSFFHSGFMLKSLNETLITIIPKIDNPINLSNYRPISLCNVKLFPKCF